jgi:hypothetical protein
MSNSTDQSREFFIARAKAMLEQNEKARILNGALLDELLVTLKHARTFITSRQKMHPDGVELYDDLILTLEQTIEFGEKPKMF